MRIAHAPLRSTTPYSQSRMHAEPKAEKETWRDWEERTWKLKAHTNDSGRMFIPPMSFKMCLDACAKRLAISIPGRGKMTYTKSFLSGVLVMDELELEETPDTCEAEWINANSDGVRGSGKRVPRCFPVVKRWKGTVPFNILADDITQPVFERVLNEAGNFVGIGRFRPENGGFYGRFMVDGPIRWETV